MWILLEAEVTLTAAQLIAKTAVTLATAPAGQIIVPVWMALKYEPGDTPFDQDGKVTFKIGDEGVSDGPTLGLSGTDGEFAFQPFGQSLFDSTDVAGQSLTVREFTTVANGNGSVKINVKYYLLAA